MENSQQQAPPKDLTDVSRVAMKILGMFALAASTLKLLFPSIPSYWIPVDSFWTAMWFGLYMLALSEVRRK